MFCGKLKRTGVEGNSQSIGWGRRRGQVVVQGQGQGRGDVADWEVLKGQGVGLVTYLHQPASLLATREGFLWGRSCGVGMWSPVISVFSGAAAAGNCLFLTFALAML